MRARSGATLLLFFLGCSCTELGCSRAERTPIVTGDAGAAQGLTFLAADLSDDQQAELRAIAPGVRIVAGLTPEEALRIAPQVDGVDARYVTASFLARARRLAWIHSRAVGVEDLLALPAVSGGDRIVLTTSGGATAPVVAEHAFALLLTLSRALLPGSGPPVSLQGRTMLVLGLGRVGSEVARRARAFDMRVLAIRRHDAPAPDFVDRAGTLADLDTFLAAADVVVIALPLTAETRGLIGREAIEKMKRGAYLVNVARGQIVDTGALVDALAAGQLAGAGLDVTDPEPLADDHPLRRLPNVIVTRHVASHSDTTGARTWAVLRENVRRFGAREPLLNVVDKAAGY